MMTVTRHTEPIAGPNIKHVRSRPRRTAGTVPVRLVDIAPRLGRAWDTYRLQHWQVALARSGGRERDALRMYLDAMEHNARIARGEISLTPDGLPVSGQKPG